MFLCKTGYTKEEHKMINETRKILGKPNLAVTATTVRVPVENCHGESINVEFENDYDINDVKSLLQKSEGICLYDDPNNNVYPLASVANGKDLVYVGRIRRDLINDNAITLWCCGDQVRKGAATNAVQIALKLVGLDF